MKRSNIYEEKIIDNINQLKEQAAVYNRTIGYYFDENIIVTNKDTLYSTHVEFEISYDIATSEKITELSATSIDFILTVTLKDQKVLTFDLGEYLPSSGNITFDPSDEEYFDEELVDVTNTTSAISSATDTIPFTWTLPCLR